MRALDAALTVFARYGYQRASMADIAREAGVSRPSLYLWFENKPALFNALADHLKVQALTGAEAAWSADRDFEANLEATILAKDLTFYTLLHASPHGAELMSVDAALTASMVAELDAGFAATLTQRASEAAAAGQIDLAAFDDAAGFGRTLGLLASGLKHEVRSEASWREGVRALCRLTARAVMRR
jgi:AcrR family transcriptional regulator